ncbi:MAG: hypothetical protein QME81_17530, partial [bacterium]|nr:hypothetical protein [bacterium]
MLPAITIELRHLQAEKYESRIRGVDEEDILRNEFELKEDDAYLVSAHNYLGKDARRKDKDIEKGFIQRMGKHFYDLISPGETFKQYLRSRPDLHQGYHIVFKLDSRTVKEMPEIKGAEKEAAGFLAGLLGDILSERRKTHPDGITQLKKNVALLWHVPWEYLHDGEEFLALSPWIHLARQPIGLRKIRAHETPSQWKMVLP